MTYLDSLPLRTWVAGEALSSTALNEDAYRPMLLASQRPSALLTLSEARVVEPVVDHVVPLDRYSFDTDGVGVSGGAVIRTEGLYEVNYQVAWTGNDDLDAFCWVTLNGVEIPHSRRQVYAGNGAHPWLTAGGAVDIELSLNDRLALHAWHSSASEVFLRGSSAEGNEGLKCHLAITWASVRV